LKDYKLILFVQCTLRKPNKKLFLLKKKSEYRELGTLYLFIILTALKVPFWTYYYSYYIVISNEYIVDIVIWNIILYCLISCYLIWLSYNE